MAADDVVVCRESEVEVGETLGEAVSSSPTGGPRAGRWPGYAASACAFLFAAVSFYWGLGGTLGLDTVGRGAVELSRSGGVGVSVVLWSVGFVKAAGGVLALALVQPWGRRTFRTWMLLSAGWGGSVLLLLYGGVQITAQLLVVCGAVEAPADMDWRGFHGHLYIWNPWFLLWGFLLATAALSFTRGTRRHEAPGAVSDREGTTGRTA